MAQTGGNAFSRNATLLRSKYVTDSVETMSPGRIIVALYDRCLLDLDRAVSGIEHDNLVATHAALVHAQAIINELTDALDVERWPAARQLISLYQFVNAELVVANVSKDAARIFECRQLLAPLRDAWYEASGAIGSSGETE